MVKANSAIKEYEVVMASATASLTEEKDEASGGGEVAKQLRAEMTELEKHFQSLSFRQDVLQVSTSGKAFVLTDIDSLRSNVQEQFGAARTKWQIGQDEAKAWSPFHLNLMYHEAKTALENTADRATFDNVKKQNTAAMKVVKNIVSDFTKDATNVSKRSAALKTKLQLTAQIGAISSPAAPALGAEALARRIQGGRKKKITTGIAAIFMEKKVITNAIVEHAHGSELDTSKLDMAQPFVVRGHREQELMGYVWEHGLVEWVYGAGLWCYCIAFVVVLFAYASKCSVLLVFVIY